MKNCHSRTCPDHGREICPGDKFFGQKKDKFVFLICLFRFSGQIRNTLVYRNFDNPPAVLSRNWKYLKIWYFQVSSPQHFSSIYWSGSYHPIPRAKSSIHILLFLQDKLEQSKHENCCSVDTWDMLSSISGSDGRFIPRGHPRKHNRSRRTGQLYKCINYGSNDQDYLGWSSWNTIREYMAFPVWFMGFAKKGSGIATVGAFILSREALIVTPKNKPSQIGEGIWWYYNNISFGFAPNSTINQNKVDIFNPTDPRRLSSRSQFYESRPYRLGATPVDEESQYYSIFFVCDPSKMLPPTPSPTATSTPTASTVPPTKRCVTEPTKCPTRKPIKNRCRPTRSPKPARE